MPKDNETIHLPLDGPVMPSEPQGFAADQMIRCDDCLRANPPTRVSCLYCSAALPHTESSARLRKPVLKQPERHEPGFNCILVSKPPLELSDASLGEAAGLLKLTTVDLQRLCDCRLPVPLARTASRDEAQLVFERLHELKIQTLILSDEVLGNQEIYLSRPRSFQFEGNGFTLVQTPGKAVVTIDWSDVVLLVLGRLVVKKVEVTERITRRSKKELLDTSQFFSDEAVIDLYTSRNPHTWRIGANSFNFSCLQDQKTLVAEKNLKHLRELIISKAVSARVDDTYSHLRTVLEPIWPSVQETHSRGWRRERPGKYNLGATTLNSNETQFTRYSRLRRHCLLNDLG